MSELVPQGDREDLRRELQELSSRVARIEAQLNLPAAAPAVAGVPSAVPPYVVLAESARAIPVLGRALLGLAGAYVLRAITESGAVPQAIGIFAGILFAMGWLAWAARTQEGRHVEAAVYSLTSALVLAPLLWEVTVRFHAISTWVSAGVLFFFALFGMAISWRKKLLMVATIATITGAVTAAALLIGSHDVVPFTFLLLAMAATGEVSAFLDHWPGGRWLTAAGADLAVLLATYLVTNGRGLPETYVPIAPAALLAAQMSLLGIYLPGIAMRTLLRDSKFTLLETAQLAFTLVLALAGGMRVERAAGRGAAIAAVTLGCAFVCYGLSVILRKRRGEPESNSRRFALFAFVLAITGTRMLLAPSAAGIVWLVLAVILIPAGAMAPPWHGSAYLLTGLLASGALPAARELLLGGAVGHRSLGPVVWAAPVALTCYGMAIRTHQRRLFRGIASGAAFWLAGALAAGLLTGAYHGIFGALAPHAYCGTIRTAVLALGALLLARVASRRGWRELTVLVYLVMAVAAYRLVFVEFRQDVKIALILSLLVYGGSLMILPSWMEPRRTSSG
ncbi:MAG: hypothetical protein C5B51_06400 [Terriglobia bacterium]|nr:MAG: hypothetical protein C5B51_06400 [Terriglobia bacterium]